MLKTVKKLFDWTPSDIAAWEKIRQKGLGHFLLWYELSFGGVMFVLLGAVNFFNWIGTSASLAFLLFELAVICSVCLLGGIIVSLATWWLEERIYRKIMQTRSVR